jgi:hypothetical protein
LYVTVNNIPTDTVSPDVATSYSPNLIHLWEDIHFSIIANDSGGLKEMTLYVDNASVRTCSIYDPTVYHYDCVYNGTFSQGNHTYYSIASDISNNTARDPAIGSYGFTILANITGPPVICGDSFCDASESCSLCSQDCGQCITTINDNGGSSGNGGRGGSGGSGGGGSGGNGGGGGLHLGSFNTTKQTSKSPYKSYSVFFGTLPEVSSIDMTPGNTSLVGLDTGINSVHTSVELGVKEYSVGSADAPVTDATIAGNISMDTIKVYTMMELEHTGIDNTDFTYTTISFKVSNSWIINNGLTPGDIVLYRLEGNMWRALDTSAKSTDGSDTLFISSSPGLSLFTVGSRPPAAHVEVPASETGANPVQESPGQIASPKGLSSLTYASLGIVLLILIAGAGAMMHLARLHGPMQQQITISKVVSLTDTDVKKKIEQYIRKYSAQGYSLVRIKEALVSTGTDAQLVDEVIRDLKL